jgi:hypothetical protein
VDIPKQYQGKYDHLLYQKLYLLVIPVVILFVIPDVIPDVAIAYTACPGHDLYRTPGVAYTPCTVHTLYRTLSVLFQINGNNVPGLMASGLRSHVQGLRSQVQGLEGLEGLNEAGLKVSWSQAPKHRFPSVAIHRKILTHPGQVLPSLGHGIVNPLSCQFLQGLASD